MTFWSEDHAQPEPGNPEIIHIGIVTYFYFFKSMPKRKKDSTNDVLMKKSNGDWSHNNSFNMKSLSSEESLAKKDDEDDLRQVSRPDFPGPSHRQ